MIGALTGALTGAQWRVVLAVLALVAGLAAVVVGVRSVYSDGFQAGQLHEKTTAREAMDARQREDQRLAGQLAATARAEAQGWRDNAHRLQQEIRRAQAPLLVAPSCVRPVGGPAGADGTAAAADAIAAGPGPAASSPHLSPQLPDGAAELQLTARAVGLWNSALAGAVVPAGACGTADAPSGACDAATDLTLADAWANLAENAARCGIDRAHHQRLIEFLQRRQAGASSPSP